MVIFCNLMPAYAAEIVAGKRVSQKSVELPDPDLDGGYRLNIASVTANQSVNNKKTSRFDKSAFPKKTFEVGYTGNFTYSITAQSPTPNYRVGIYWIIPDNGMYYPEFTTMCNGASSFVYETVDIDRFEKNAEYVGYIENFADGAISGKLTVFALYTV